jgi:hypothetical protein
MLAAALSIGSRSKKERCIKMFWRMLSLPLKIVLLLLAIPLRIVGKLIGMGLAMIMPIIMLEVVSIIMRGFKKKGSRTASSTKRSSPRIGTFTREEE